MPYATSKVNLRSLPCLCSFRYPLIDYEIIAAKNISVTKTDEILEYDSYSSTL